MLVSLWDEAVRVYGKKAQEEHMNFWRDYKSAAENCVLDTRKYRLQYAGEPKLFGLSEWFTYTPKYDDAGNRVVISTWEFAMVFSSTEISVTSGIFRVPISTGITWFERHNTV